MKTYKNCTIKLSKLRDGSFAQIVTFTKNGKEQTKFTHNIKEARKFIDTL